jgi:Putative RNA methylase family UPF0020
MARRDDGAGAQGFRIAARRLLTDTGEATAASANEQNLRYAIEGSLERQCLALGIPWTPYQLDRALRNEEGRISFADVVHGAMIIEYEPPGCFGAGRAVARVEHAQQQAIDYASRMAFEEGRPIGEYFLIVWDGAHLAFGDVHDDRPRWERIQAFDQSMAERLLHLLRDQGRPLVHPAILRQLIGPDSEVGARLLPELYRAIRAGSKARGGVQQTKTTLLFTEWRRLFGQAIGAETGRLAAYLADQSRQHGERYDRDVPAYLFALHTYIAGVAKIVAAMALPNAAQDIADSATPVRQRLLALESGQLFADAGITNMLTGDFFSWYADDASWPDMEAPFGALLASLRGVSFDLTHKRPESIRDLFKGIYEVFVPRQLRHALGEVYTPDWLAAHALDEMGWTPHDELLDPTCGTGTFLLEALKRRLVRARGNGNSFSAADALKGLYGIDLNPLAVLAAKASIVVVLASRLLPDEPITLPIYLADAINSAEPSSEGFYVHTLQTEVGERRFEIPAALVRSDKLYTVFDRLRQLISAGLPAVGIMAELAPLLAPLRIAPPALKRFEATIGVLVDLHRNEWDGIWCPILADRFAAGAIEPVSHIVGNPPWVKWSHLPDSYAKFIKPICMAMNVFSTDRYVGGIESDISTVITFKAAMKWLAPRGRLAFFITATVFANESSQGFRRFAHKDGTPIAQILSVEDFQSVEPFYQVTNHPALLIVEQGASTQYPVRYRVWTPGEGSPATFEDGRAFRAAARHCDLLARPVPGSDAGPWLKGTQAEHAIWARLFDAGQEAHYRARKGITTDLNGVYFVRAEAAVGDLVWVTNDPTAGRKGDLPRIRRRIEAEHVFPLIRGRGVRAFRAEPDPSFRVIVPQRGMHGDPDLPTSARRTHRFLSEFEAWLRERGSYRRYQSNQPFWSTWSTGPYTFSPYKVLWKEMSGTRFSAAYIGSSDDTVLGHKVVVPDHKLYFVPIQTLQEARYLTGILNAPAIARAIAGYAAQLSLGTSVIENLTIPAFDAGDQRHRNIAQIAGDITGRSSEPTSAELADLNRLAQEVVSEHGA